MYWQNIESLEDLATYLNEGVNNRKRTMQESNGGRADHLMGEIQAFNKVLEILDKNFNVTP